jgi:hypothetical protein
MYHPYVLGVKFSKDILKPKEYNKSYVYDWINKK